MKHPKNDSLNEPFVYSPHHNNNKGSTSVHTSPTISPMPPLSSVNHKKPSTLELELIKKRIDDYHLLTEMGFKNYDILLALYYNNTISTCVSWILSSNNSPPNSPNNPHHHHKHYKPNNHIKIVNRSQSGKYSITIDHEKNQNKDLNKPAKIRHIRSNTLTLIPPPRSSNKSRSKKSPRISRALTYTQDTSTFLDQLLNSPLTSPLTSPIQKLSSEDTDLKTFTLSPLHNSKVVNFLKNHHFIEYIDQFQKHKITYDQLFTLDKDDLHSLGMIALGDKKRFLSCISSTAKEQLKQQQQQQTAAAAMMMMINSLITLIYILVYYKPLF